MQRNPKTIRYQMRLISSKQVILMVVDALTWRVLKPEIDPVDCPISANLCEAGCSASECIAIFPSITHAALASLATGTYPMEHGVPGGHWSDTDSEQTVHLLGETIAVWNRGPLTFAESIGSL